MNDQHRTHEPARLDGGRTRPRWWAVGLAGVTGLALTATVGVAPSAADAVGRAVATTGDHPTGVPVPCDADKLIAAITLANARGGAVLDLAKDCTYLLTTELDGAGLPAITTPITLNGGKNTTLERAAAADPFRILAVDSGGELTLNRLTVTGGQTAGGDGGGLLVNAGGHATLSRVEVVNNVSDQMGGGVANSGTVVAEHSSISRNVAAVNGGGVYATGQLTVVSAQVEKNAAINGAGIGSAPGSVIRIEHSSITGNGAEFGGGGQINGTGYIADSKIADNTAAEVGGIAVFGPTTMRRVSVVNNAATEFIAGGLFVAPGLPVPPVAVLEDSRIDGNTAATDGGGILNAGQVVLRRTKVAGNQAGGEGGGIFNAAVGTATLFTTKILKNIAATDGGGIFNEVGGTVNLNTATGTVVAKNRPNNCVNVPGCSG
ncbi:hypothetical protein Strop_1297 [Salinispora tropica CNB-440]|uniref:Polymorphic outer membrane protein n=1 Tax=Salinispora tropica (strain ATCC BAA-916 / DSM 44818 / JCM 13857 / NBRC 105044 / CNB-440) TaxID=369723 RepID=A4X4G7_SALTO|nr:hypothetical protein Strop_1297 [Salinispora tropica CNB-440]